MEHPARLAALIRLLRACGRCDAAALAARLDVSRRSIYRDAARLAAAGVPVTGTRGAGYRYDDEHPVVRLDLDLLDAVALLAAFAADPGTYPAEREVRRGLVARVEARLPPVVRDALGADVPR